MTPQEINYINSLMGKRWVAGGIGPEEFDCWGLAREVQKTMFDRDLPILTINANNIREVIQEVATTTHRRKWKRVDGPTHGALVEMTHGKHPFHIGVYLDVEGGGILHCHNPVGVCFDTELTLKVSGWRRFLYNDWIG